jgi:hypothetical protein
MPKAPQAFALTTPKWLVAVACADSRPTSGTACVSGRKRRDSGSAPRIVRRSGDRVTIEPD